jgi:hypothetical protein
MPKQQTDAVNAVHLHSYAGYFGFLTIIATFCVYWLKPFWPVTVRHFPWLPWASPVFIIFLISLLFYVQKQKLSELLISSIVGLSLYFFIEGFGWTLLFSRIDGLTPPSTTGYFFIGLINTLANLPAVAVFILLQIALVIWRRG